MVLIKDSDEREYVDKIEITIGNASFTENYPERIKKAIEHLVELTGGLIIKDKL